MREKMIFHTPYSQNSPKSMKPTKSSSRQAHSTENPLQNLLFVKSGLKGKKE